MNAWNAIRCKECENLFVPTSQHRLYCCDECAKENRKKALRVAGKKYYMTHISKYQKPKRELICKSCGDKFYGHGNAKYCDTCLQSNYKLKKLYYQRKVI